MYDDAYRGQGGSYRFDPKTGKREIVERTEDAPLAPPPAELPAQPTPEGEA